MIKIEEREVLLDTAWTILESENMIIIDLNTVTKYPKVGIVVGPSIYLHADEHSLYKGSDPKPTMVELDLPDGWSIHPTNHGRYKIRIYCVREAATSSDNAKLIWEKQG